MANGHGGTRSNAGRKSKAEEMGLVQLLNECFTEDDRRKVINQLVTDATNKEISIRDSARKLLLAYTFGQPAAKHEIGGKNGDPIQHRYVVEVVDDAKLRSNKDKNK